MKYLEVPGWEKYQSGRRSPGAPWIKLHVKLLHNPEFNRLPPGARWLLISIWMCTALRGHWVDFDHTYLQDMAHLGRSYRTLWVQKLITAGFLRVVEARSCTEKEIEREREKKPPKPPLRSRPKSTTETAASMPGKSPGFDLFWETYPDRNGRKAGKREALNTWKQIKAEPHTEAILKKLKNQIEHKRKADQAGQFVAEFPDAHRWLKKRRFNDEIKR